MGYHIVKQHDAMFSPSYSEHYLNPTLEATLRNISLSKWIKRQVLLWPLLLISSTRILHASFVFVGEQNA